MTIMTFRDLARAERPLGTRSPTIASTEAVMADRFADMAVEALLVEVHLTPKPGLVDRRNNGSHRDMTLVTFLASAGTLGPGFRKSFLAGVAGRNEPADVLRDELRTIGLASERAMFAVTGGVNTHKGSIFAFGLLLGAAGRMIGRGDDLDADGVCDEVADMVAGIVERELGAPREWRTAGERLFALHGLTGARGEAASGFATVRDHGLPAYRRMIAAGHDTETALLEVFLTLLAVNRDTNVAARGGMEGLAWARREAQALLDAGGLARPDGRARLAALDDAFIARNLSPGGSADLLAVTWFLDSLDA